MKRFYVVAIIIFAFSGLSAQFGVRFSYSDSSIPYLESLKVDINGRPTTKVFGSGYGIGIDYGFLLSWKRIEFYPEISISNYKKTFTDRDYTLNNSLLALGINTHFYPLDFNNDCHCPALLKNGNVFKKGLFLSIKPSLHYNLHNVNGGSNSGDLSPALGVGIGLDLGISNRLLLSPFMQYDWHHNTDWDKVPIQNIFGNRNTGSNTFKQLKLGIRIGFRSDDK